MTEREKESMMREKRQGRRLDESGREKVGWTERLTVEKAIVELRRVQDQRD